MINNNLMSYLKENIIPLYDSLDLAHKSDHVYEVIDISFEIAKDYNLNLEMVYTIAVFHDVGLIEDRKLHHEIGAKMLLEDSFLKEYFTNDELIIMSEAVFDHRASSNNAPRSIYGKVIAEADRSNSMDDIFKRCYLYEISKNGLSDFETMHQVVLNHILEKYSEDGYLKVWLKTKRVEDVLNNIRDLLKNETEYLTYNKMIYEEVINNL